MDRPKLEIQIDDQSEEGLTVIRFNRKISTSPRNLDLEAKLPLDLSDISADHETPILMPLLNAVAGLDESKRLRVTTRVLRIVGQPHPGELSRTLTGFARGCRFVPTFVNHHPRPADATHY